MNQETSSSSGRAWLVVGLLFVVGCLNYLDRNMITTMRLSLIAAIPMSDAKFALLLSVFLWTYALLSPFAGYAADRIGRSRVIVASLFVWSLTTWLTAHAHTYGELMATRVLMGISEAAYIPSALALIADYHGHRTRSLATGIHLSGVMVGSALGGIGGWLAERHTWHYPFGIFGAFGTVYAVVLALVLRDPPQLRAAPTESGSHEPAPRMFATLGRLLREPSYLLCLGFFGLLGVLGWGLTGWLPTFIHERFHLDQGAAGLTATISMNSATFAGVLIGGLLGDIAARSRPEGRIRVVAVGLLIAAVGVLVFSHAPLLPLAVAGIATYGVTRTFSDSNMMPILCLIAPRRERATGYGMINFVSCLIGGIGNYGAGALRDAHIPLSTTFLSMTGVLLISAFLVSRIKPDPAVLLHDV